MALTVASVLLLLGLASRASACSTPPGGCTYEMCESLRGMRAPTNALNGDGWLDTRIGFYYGGYNKNTTDGNNPRRSSRRGGPIVNYEIFPIIETNFLVRGVDTSGVTTLADCCHLCAETDGCWVYNFYASRNLWEIRDPWGTRATNWTRNFDGSTQCYLLTGGTDKNSTSRGAPYSGTKTEQLSWNPRSVPNRFFPPSWVGGMCNGNSSVEDDPHFVGALGTRFDFNGDVDKAFNLITDEKVHVNMRLGGYLDSRTEGAKVLKDGKAIRTWIKELGFLWEAPDGSKHSAWLAARAGKEQKRADGFISHLVVDGARVAVPSDGAEVQEGIFRLKALKVEQRGPYEVEEFRLAIGGLFEAIVNLRVAHEMLQTETDAQAHLNVHVMHLDATPNVHGVLGQTFRNTASQHRKSFQFKMLTRLLGEPINADGDTGLGFLDGTPSDYEVDDILSPNFRFSSFKL